MSALRFLTFLAVVGCGLVAGVFFAFSTFVMRALRSLPHVQGIRVMQAINVHAVNAWFMTALSGTATACLIVMIVSFIRWEASGSWYSLAGGSFRG
jgi:uncharacterized membrane protein